MQDEDTPTVNLANAFCFLALGAAMTVAAEFLPAHFFASSVSAAGSTRQLWVALMGLVTGAIGSGYLLRPVLTAGLHALRTARPSTNPPAGKVPAYPAVRTGHAGVRSAG